LNSASPGGGGIFDGVFSSSLALKLRPGYWPVSDLIATSTLRDMWMKVFLDGRPDKDWSKIYFVMPIAFNAISCLLLCAAVALMVGKFFWL
jgi:hypothetical protein